MGGREESKAGLSATAASFLSAPLDQPRLRLLCLPSSLPAAFSADRAEPFPPAPPRTQFKTNAPSVRGSDATAGIEVAITGVKSIEGDVTVGQRKSKSVRRPCLTPQVLSGDPRLRERCSNSVRPS